MHTLLGLQYRPTFFINIYNRLRSLDFSDKPHQDPNQPQYSLQSIDEKATKLLEETVPISEQSLNSDYAPLTMNSTILNSAANTDSDSTFSFTNLNELNIEINSFI